MNINNDTPYTPPRPSSNSKLFVIIFALTGIGMLAGAFFFYQGTARRIASMSSATGRVVDIEITSSSDGISQVPVVEFSSAAGQVVRGTSFEGQGIEVSSDIYRVGQTVEVYYDAQNPRDMFINDFMHTWFAPVLLGGMGALFFLIGAGTFIFQRRMQASV